MGIKERLARLIDVKSLVTLALVAVLCAMTVLGRETGGLFDNSVMLVLGFFFGKNLKQSTPETGQGAQEAEQSTQEAGQDA